MNDGRVRFGVFEFSPTSGELLRDGTPVKLQAQPARVLAVLLAQPGEIVSRETLQRKVWGPGTHVDFERGLNFCIAQVRSALGDSADSPRYIATVPKLGYRFIAPVASQVATAPRVPDPPVPISATDKPATGSRWPVVAIVAGLAALALAWPLWGRLAPPPDTVVVVPFYNETGRPELDGLARSLSDVTVVRLATPERIPQLSVIGNAPSLRHPFARTEVQEIATRLGAQWVVIGQLKSDSQGLRLVGHLIRSGDMKHVWAQTFDDAAFELAAQERTAEAMAAGISQALASN